MMDQIFVLTAIIWMLVILLGVTFLCFLRARSELIETRMDHLAQLQTHRKFLNDIQNLNERSRSVPKSEG